VYSTHSIGPVAVIDNDEAVLDSLRFSLGLDGLRSPLISTAPNFLRPHFDFILLRHRRSKHADYCFLPLTTKADSDLGEPAIFIAEIGIGHVVHGGEHVPTLRQHYSDRTGLSKTGGATEGAVVPRLKRSPGRALQEKPPGEKHVPGKPPAMSSSKSVMPDAALVLSGPWRDGMHPDALRAQLGSEIAGCRFQSSLHRSFSTTIWDP
jgi:hypothetical protein